VTGRRELRNIAVLGGTGLVGRHVVEALSKVGASGVTATYRRRPAANIAGVTWRQVDLLDRPDAEESLEGARKAVICAGRVSTAAELQRNPIASVQETLRIGVNALEAAAGMGLEQVVLIGSCTGYPSGKSVKDEAGMFAGDPPGAWFGVGWMHRFLEKQLEWYVQLGRIRSAIVLRPTLIYGPYDDFQPESAHFVPSLIRRVVEREKPIEIWGDGSQSRNLIHTRDVAAAVLAGLSSPEPFAAYNVAATGSASVKDVLSTLIDLDGFTDANLVYLPDLASGAAALDVSSAAFSAKYGWTPSVPLREGLRETLAWYRATR
jgi:GDP-L-fucose synthase